MTTEDTQLVRGGRGPALNRIVESLIPVIADMLGDGIRVPYKDGQGRQKSSWQKFPQEAREAFVRDVLLVRSLGVDGNIPWFGFVDFRALRPKAYGRTVLFDISEITPEGGGDAELVATPRDVRLEDYPTIGITQVVEGGREKVIEGYGLINLNGAGGLVEYIPEGHASASHLCLRVRDIRPNTLRIKKGKMTAKFATDSEDNPRYKFVLMALADQKAIKAWNTANANLDASADEHLVPIINDLHGQVGRRIERRTSWLAHTAEGDINMPVTHDNQRGLLPMWRFDDEIDLEKPPAGGFILGRFGGKNARLHRESRPIPWVDDEGWPLSIFLVRESWSSIEAHFLKPWGSSIGGYDLGVREIEDVQIPALEALGLESVFGLKNPNQGVQQKRKLMRMPLDEHNPGLLAARKYAGVLPDTDTDIALSIMESVLTSAAKDLNSMAFQKAEDIVGEATTAGGGPSFKKLIPKRKRTHERAMALLHKKEGTNALTKWILTLNACKGVEEWNWNSWALKRAYKRLVRQLAEQAGLEGLLKKPETSSDDSDNGSGGDDRPVNLEEINPTTTPTQEAAAPAK